MKDNNLAAALIAARVPDAVRAMRAYRTHAASVAVRLDANEAPALLPTLSAEERAIWNDAMLSIEPARYPDIRAGIVRDALARSLGVSGDELVIGCGSDEVIAMLFSALGRRVGGAAPTVLVPTPTFVMYATTARVHGWNVQEVPLDASWDIDERAMLDALEQHRPALVFLATPNNPTSGVYDLARVERIVQRAGELDPPAMVVIDEAYLPFRLGEGDPWNGVTGLDLRARGPHVIVMRTLSKVGLAALRVGWLVAHPTVASEIDKTRLPYDLPAWSQVGAATALGPLAPAIARHVRSIIDERARLLRSLAELGDLRIGRSDANFVWMGLPRPATEVVESLIAHGVLVRGFPAFPDRIRVSVGTSDDNARLLFALAAATSAR